MKEFIYETTSSARFFSQMCHSVADCIIQKYCNKNFALQNLFSIDLIILKSSLLQKYIFIIIFMDYQSEK